MKRIASAVSPDTSVRSTALFVAVVLAFLAVVAQARCGGGKVREVSEGATVSRLAVDPSMAACRLDGSRLGLTTATDRRTRGQDIEALMPAMPLLGAARGTESRSRAVCADFDRSDPTTHRILRI